jgi:hypothetical protein
MKNLLDAITVVVSGEIQRSVLLVMVQEWSLNESEQFLVSWNNLVRVIRAMEQEKKYSKNVLTAMEQESFL